MRNMKPIQNNNEWARNEENGVIYHTGKNQLDSYLEKHKMRSQLSMQQDQINRLEKEMSELKKMLCTII